MKYNYVYEIVWEYVGDDSASHRTLIEISRRSDSSARLRFDKFHKRLHLHFPLCYSIISVRCLGKVIKKCW